MLIGFSVSNFKSFYEPQNISFVASKITRHKNHTVLKGKRRILKSGLIFGANASGKSNLIRAIDFSRNVIINGLEQVDTNKKHFRINNNAFTEPGVFEYRIIANEKEYSYGIALSYSKKEIIGEWLTRINDNNTETCIFYREVNDDGISIVSSEVIKNDEQSLRIKVYLDDFGTNISDSLKKKTILSDISQRTNTAEGALLEIVSVFLWFQNIDFIFPSSQYNGLSDVANDNSLRNFFSKVISYFDTGINSVEGQDQRIDFDVILRGLPKEDAERIKIDVSNNVSESPKTYIIQDQILTLRQDENGNIVYSKMLLNHGNPGDLFEYADESDGTQRLFDLIPIFFESRTSSVIFIDEIDRSLHTNLTRKFLELFYELSDDNSCQIIATTHDSNLLDLDLVRQDEIWFVERTTDHSSKIYSLNKFKQRFDKKIEKEYLIGRYGAIPSLNDIVLETESDPYD